MKIKKKYESTKQQAGFPVLAIPAILAILAILPLCSSVSSVVKFDFGFAFLRVLCG